MKQKLQYEQTMKQTLTLSNTMKSSLQVLKMGRNELIQHIHQQVRQNPFLEYTPLSQDQYWMEETIHAQRSLQDELFYQLHTTTESYDEQAANFIIESLDEHGFFPHSYEVSAKQLHIPLEAFLTTLSIIQNFEPVGVAAKNSIDSVVIQLHHDYLEEAAEILIHYSQELAEKEYETIARERGLSIEEVISYVYDIQDCSPYPCQAYHSTLPQQIEVDFTIFVEGDTCRIEPKEIGNIQLLDLPDNQLDPALKTYFQEARFFIDHLNRRNKTLLLIANEILNVQQSYFLYQDELQACTRKEIAIRTGFSQSTVSRTIHGKYFEFQQAIRPLSSLLISSTAAGSSKDAVSKAILMFIEQEDHAHPLLDEELVKQLEEIELYCSRRTISKYRKQLHIPNSKERKKAYQ